MALFRTTLRHQLAVIRCNPMVFTLVLAIAAFALWVGHLHGRMDKAVAYVAVVGAGIFLIDLFAQWKPSGPAFPVRRPMRESLYALGCCAVGYVTLFGRFVWLDWDAQTGPVRMVFLVLFAFVFPIAIAIILLLLKYRPRDLGFRWSGSAWVFLPVLCLIAFAGPVVAPEDVMWGRMLAEEGVAGIFFKGFIMAALSEEFLRFTLQTRVGAWWNNGMGWYIAAVLWAFLHVPKWLGEGGDVLEGVIGALRIVPIGLLWGYLTYRTRSIWPAIICHGLNLWGLQSF